MVDGGST
ncbi:hypothetical protein A2U01_0086681, partial [Trifolium medium]|nr:hypothetical protein [Trifolium medium]